MEKEGEGKRRPRQRGRRVQQTLQFLPISLSVTQLPRSIWKDCHVTALIQHLSPQEYYFGLVGPLTLNLNLSVVFPQKYEQHSRLAWLYFRRLQPAVRPAKPSRSAVIISQIQGQPDHRVHPTPPSNRRDGWTERDARLARHPLKIQHTSFTVT